MSNVIDLEARRRQRLEYIEAYGQRGGRVFTAAGSVLLACSVAFLGFVAYQAVRLEILGDTFVVGLVVALAAYATLGGALVRFGRRLPRGRLQSMHLARNASPVPATVVEFPVASPGAMISIRCMRCASRYVASVTNTACPSCGRAAMAG